MAISVDTVYQRVLALANKEQRGYITPQEFNLFANQAQMEIFEQYFFDKNQYNRLPKDNTPYADLNHLLEEKISIFKKRQQPVTITNQFGDGVLPTDLYRLDNLTRMARTEISGDRANIIEEVTEDEMMVIDRALLTRPTIERPIYTRKSATNIKIKPHSSSPSASAAPYFTVEGFDVNNGSADVVVSTGANKYSFIEVGQDVTGAGIQADTTVTVVNNGTITLSKTANGSADPTTLTFATDDIKCNYIRKPVAVNWNYTEINGTALYNSASSTDFELHDAEEPTLVYRILALAGVSISDPNLYQIAAAEENKITQQEKQ
tara:strand:+ start:790 stop:1749 length:960 start_codon:yes stop_codon:yes gene_type:complete